ncbi:MAG: hypothetical protein ACTIJ9_16325 [Aequorivita sp.]
MKEFLTNINPPKYLRYFFYIIYSFYRNYKSERTDGHITAIIFLAFMHMLLFLSLVFFIEDYFSLSNYQDYTNTYFTILITGLLFYFGFYFNKKWKRFIKEFEKTTSKQRKIGAIYLFNYLFIIIYLVFSPYIAVMLKG